MCAASASSSILEFARKGTIVAAWISVTGAAKAFIHFDIPLGASGRLLRLKQAIDWKERIRLAPKNSIGEQASNVRSAA